MTKILTANQNNVNMILEFIKYYDADIYILAMLLKRFAERSGLAHDPCPPRSCAIMPGWVRRYNAVTVPAADQRPVGEEYVHRA
jgi:hypothetical protein